MQARDVLATDSFFADALSPAELDSLAERARQRRFASGDRLIREDDVGGSLFIVVSGEVTIDTGDRQTGKHIATGGAGTVVGEMSLMTGARRSANVTASTEVTALEITKSALEPILATSPVLVDRFAAMLKRRQSELDLAYGAGGRFSGGELARRIRSFFGLGG
ncbi:MAG: cyclic nucleotide-binding domain-containing protein [Bauldia sp.]|uniref:cyclic nucleotide-binding domain-containing protein n=1 Tax=Bauldia sp. TaxID=2575872 RepID=UPI001D7B9EF7|nr:cyclic nucleotide-binding domain-containing protein [Bauldia sp.]MCB1496432.1 cyclic nucleotide-binding domain-containing protein [Bauldia sp.]